eukprot:Rhum_TRINITY_DN24878_c0_g1::Rhum_TRINITY_DN24878_c0_g1_i1::g.180361::m.180361
MSDPFYSFLRGRRGNSSRNGAAPSAASDAPSSADTASVTVRPARVAADDVIGPAWGVRPRHASMRSNRGFGGSDMGRAAAAPSTAGGNEEARGAETRGGVCEWLRSFVRATAVSVHMTWTEYKRRSLEYVIGMFAVLIVVSVVSILLNSTAKAPVLFVKLAEENTGELDILTIADGGNGAFLNFTEHNERFRSAAAAAEAKGEEFYSPETAITPRWYITASARRKWSSTTKSLAIGNTSLSTTVVILDSKREAAMKLGRTWPHRRLGESEAHVKDTMLRQLGLEAEVGDHIVLEIDLQKLFEDNDIVVEGGFDVGGTRVDVESGDVTIPTLFLDVDVVGSIGGSEGKYPAVIGNVVILDSTYFFHTLAEQMCYHRAKETLGEDGLSQIDGLTGVTVSGGLPGIQEILDRIPMDEYALTIQGLFEDRKSLYTKSVKGMDDGVVQASNEFALSIHERADNRFEYPLAHAMAGYYYLRLFLDQIFNAIIISIVILGCILVYTLLLSNAEKKTYEHGMLRALGFRKVHLVNLITVQALSFAIPGTAAAMLIAYIGSVVVEKGMSGVSGFPADYSDQTDLSIGLPIALGFVVPLVSNIYPIQRALGKSLRGALDISHQHSSDTTVTMQKLEELGLAMWQVCLALFMVVAGFLIYYVMPFAFIFNDMSLFFFVLLCVLMAMLCGLCMISMTMQSPSEKVVLWLLVWGRDKPLAPMIRKNLCAHRARSSKLFIMFCISTATIIFGGSVFSLQVNSITDNIKVLVGSDVQLYSSSSDHPLDRPATLAILERTKADFARAHGSDTPFFVKAWAYSTFSLDTHEHISSTSVSNLLDFPAVKMKPTGVEPTFMEACFDDFFIVEESQGFKKSDLIRALYSDSGTAGSYEPPLVVNGFPPNATVPDMKKKYKASLPVVASFASKEVLSITTSNTLRFSTEYRPTLSEWEKREAEFLATPRALISKLPGWLFGASSYWFLLSGAPLIMSIDSYEHIVASTLQQEEFPHGTETLYEKLFVRFHDDVTPGQREGLVSELKSHLHRQRHHVLDTDELVEATETAVGVLMVFFYSVSAVSLFLNLFLLWVSFTSNVQQNQWTFAVMRSLGFSCGQLIRAFVFEALCTVLSAFFWGAVIGIIVAVTLTAQYNMFLETPLRFVFPTVLFFVVLLEALIAAIVGSWWPANHIKKQSIAQVLKAS